MLTCRELAHRHASDYIDGQLGWRARFGVWYHLCICDHCRRFVAQLRKVRKLLRNKPQSRVIHDAVEQAAQQLSQQQLAEQLAKVYEQQKKSSPPL